MTTYQEQEAKAQKNARKRAKLEKLKALSSRSFFPYEHAALRIPQYQGAPYASFHGTLGD